MEPDRTLSELSRRTAEVRRLLHTLEGRRLALESRRDALLQSVGAAKARLALKAEVDETLERMQRSATGRVIADYEEMLSALVSDILHPDDRVKLELSTERSLPALDLFHQVGENKVDIFRGAGGSMTNVVCLGLRAIATAKAGCRRFFALDEPDCWIRPHSVPRFYAVLKRLADQGNFQTLVVSHHDIGLFGHDVNVIQLCGSPRDGLSVVVRRGGKDWEDDQTPGIRSIRLQNYAGFIDVTLPMAPGVNAIIGDHNIGKSHVMQFLRAVAYGGAESSDADIRHGERSGGGAIQLEGGKLLTFSRDPKRNPVNRWRLTDRSGAVMTLDGDECDSGKRREGAIRGDASRSVPEWVAKTLGIHLTDGLDVQLGRQKQPVFLLDQTATARAAVLSVGQESGTLNQMIALHRRRMTEDTRTVKEGEAEMGRILDQLTMMAGRMPEASEQMSELDGQLLRMQADRSAIAGLRFLGTALQTGNKSQAVSLEKCRILNALPVIPDMLEAIESAAGQRQAGTTLLHLSGGIGRQRKRLACLSDLPATPPVVVSHAQRRQDATLLSQMQHSIARQSRKISLLAGLPQMAPVLPSSAPLRDAAGTLGDAQRVLEDRQGERNRAAAAEGTARRTMDEMLAGNGSHCPMCGGHTTSDALLHQHGAHA